MAPTKFGLFKGRSRDNQEQPSTENLLQSSQSTERVQTPDSPIPSTSKGITVDSAFAELSMLNLDSDDEYSPQQDVTTRRISDSSKLDEPQLSYHILNNPSSPDATTTSTLDCDVSPDATRDIDDTASTTYDANSIQFDETSIAASEDTSVYCTTLKKKKKKNKLKMEQHRRDLGMWKASNVEVMKNLLNKSGNVDEQIKWEAIATARGLCTLTDNCTCGDCTRAKFLVGMADGDGGLGAAPIFNAISIGCQLQ
ncbi:uncharacterized protein LOC105842586 isoform X1 [Bombyx mori]|uniref:Uncharacterized protein n=1 Tax=Bombyx mori TaxID=7091 RepID=A0A8R2GEH4_BOMMO|nr:uncharacterized protein LOC105842586 isoform X1 [Bombyx mori]